MNHAAKKTRLRRIIQLSIWAVVPATIVLGLFYPLVGFIVPVVMIVGIVGGFFRGRFVCGWLCPRGAFYDRIVPFVSPRRNIPSFLRSYWLRAALLVLLMGAMVWQISLNPGDPYHWGAVFVRMCLVTTLLGIAMALVLHPRSWCSVCPVGTIQSAVGGNKGSLVIGDGCRECRACERACPINLTIVGNTGEGKLPSRDCLRCHECEKACPMGIVKLSYT